MSKRSDGNVQMSKENIIGGILELTMSTCRDVILDFMSGSGRRIPIAVGVLEGMAFLVV